MFNKKLYVTLLLVVLGTLLCHASDDCEDTDATANIIIDPCPEPPVTDVNGSPLAVTWVLIAFVLAGTAATVVSVAVVVSKSSSPLVSTPYVAASTSASGSPYDNSSYGYSTPRRPRKIQP